jgi:hypothetical protein
MRRNVCFFRYHRRSSTETTPFRFKTVFSGRLQIRQIDNQFKELTIQIAGEQTI